MSEQPVEVTALSADEWAATVRRALAELGVAYDELARQVASGEASPRACQVWAAIGGRAARRESGDGGDSA